jgi:uncharacterized protein (DUF1697 family)
MSRRIAFLRAVNLGGRRVNMAQLAQLVSGLGYADVWTHINSGNVVFDATGSRAQVERTIETALEDALGFEVTTFVRTPAEITAALAAQPFGIGPGDTYFITFLKESPSAEQRRALEALSNDFDTVVVQGRDVHWRMHGRSTATTAGGRKWAAILGEHRSTSRNTTMLRVLVDKIAARTRK